MPKHSDRLDGEAPGNPRLDFEGRVAVVTGAGRGLGRAHALLLARRGASLVVNDLGGSPTGHGSSTDPAKEVVDEILAEGGAAVASTDSVATPEGADTIVATALNAFGRIDVVVNNAGVAHSTWAQTIDVHLTGSYLVTAAAWPHLARQGYGRIVNTTSAAGLFGLEGPAGDLEFHAYAAAKAGVVGLSRGLAIEGRAHGVTVNAVAPVAISRMTRLRSEPRAIEWLDRHFPPESVAAVVAYLAHESCSLSGEVLSAGGGRVAQVFAGETEGVARRSLSPEAVRDGIADVMNRDGYFVPADTYAETKRYDEVLKNLG